MKKKFFAGIGKKNGQQVKTYMEIEITEKEKGKPVLSICGEIYQDRKLIECGQCIDEIARIVPTDKNKRIAEVWKRWHLNDLHAGCIHQRGFEKEPYEAHKDHVCPICNYKYGTSWIYEELPEEIINEVKSW